MTFGIDISTAQTGIDLAQAAREGVQFVIVKAGGLNVTPAYVAPRYQEQIDAAVKAGLPKGHYWLIGAGVTPEAQAEFFVKNLHGFDRERDVLALDNEHLDSNGDLWGDSQASRFVRRVLELTGIPAHRVWHYAGATDYRSHSWPLLESTGARFWWAAYGAGPTGHTPDHTPDLQGSIPQAHVHQFTSSAQVAGHTVDGNYSVLSVADLFGGTPTSSTASLPSTPVATNGPSAGEHRYTSTEADGIPGAIFYGRVQTLGKERGIYAGVIDGKTGPLTEVARIKLTAQACNGWKNGPHTTTDRDGIPGINYWTAVQEIGKAHFGYTGLVDGKPGPMTYAAENRICAHELNTHR